MLMDHSREVPIRRKSKEVKVVEVTGIYMTPRGLKETTYDAAHFLIRRGMKDLIKAVDERKKRDSRVMYEEL